MHDLRGRVEAQGGIVALQLGREGHLPDLRTRHGRARGELVDLAPGFDWPVDLYWHCWNLESGVLDGLTQALTGAGLTVAGAAQVAGLAAIVAAAARAGLQLKF